MDVLQSGQECSSPEGVVKAATQEQLDSRWVARQFAHNPAWKYGDDITLVWSVEGRDAARQIVFGGRLNGSAATSRSLIVAIPLQESVPEAPFFVDLVSASPDGERLAVVVRAVAPDVLYEFELQLIDADDIASGAMRAAGREALRARRFADGARLLERATQINAEDWRVLLDLACAYELLHDDRAKKVLERASALGDEAARASKQRDRCIDREGTTPTGPSVRAKGYEDVLQRFKQAWTYDSIAPR
ncbi:MAG: hypothetical protein AAGA54_21900 [Myxococcota bacterium]